MILSFWSSCPTSWMTGLQVCALTANLHRAEGWLALWLQPALSQLSSTLPRAWLVSLVWFLYLSRMLSLPTPSLSPHYVGNDNVLFNINFRVGLETTPVLQGFVSDWNSFIDSGGSTDMLIFWVSLPIIWFYLLSLIKFYNFFHKAFKCPMCICCRSSVHFFCCE